MLSSSGSDRLQKELARLESKFEISRADMRNLIKKFHREMEKGLRGKPSSLNMIPTYVARPTGRERGYYIAIDLGGTNFRIVEIELKGSGKTSTPKTKQFALEKKHTTKTGGLLFGFIAKSLKSFIEEESIEPKNIKLGFTFSFPVEQTGIASGELLKWTKGFRASGVVGRDVIGLLRNSLLQEGLNGIEVSALANDTVGTLIARSYGDRNCDVGVIIGTGTNACYIESAARIKRLHDSYYSSSEMIINTEWGNFDKLKKTEFDILLDGRSGNSGFQILEKMVSGMYLGELTRLLACDLIDKGLLFNGYNASKLRKRMLFKTEFMSYIEADDSRSLRRVKKILDSIGIKGRSFKDRAILKEISSIVSRRAARVASAALAAVVTKTDPLLRRKHTVAIDGSVYEKHPTFSINMKNALREVFGKRARNIELRLTKDGSGKGAAIIAALA